MLTHDDAAPPDWYQGVSTNSRANDVMLAGHAGGEWAAGPQRVSDFGAAWKTPAELTLWKR
ncbi:hypothetical protein BH09GEM1_BH09GEM1_19250 [soil metagenome]